MDRRPYIPAKEVSQLIPKTVGYEDRIQAFLLFHRDKYDVLPETRTVRQDQDSTEFLEQCLL